MQDLSAWSVPMGRMFGITMRMHWLFPFVALGWILHVAFAKDNGQPKFPDGAWIDASILMLILVVSTVLHELGHCFAARYVGGEARDILLWPLGGLADVQLPQIPRAHLLTAAAGPAVNLFLCLISGVLLAIPLYHSSKAPSPATNEPVQQALQPVWNPFPSGFPKREIVDSKPVVTLTNWSGEDVAFTPYQPAVWLARTFWINWFLGLLNLVLVGFPLDGGRILQASLWPSMGYRQATLVSVFAGFVVVFLVALYGIVVWDLLALCLALFIYFSCQRQWAMVEMGGDTGVFGYDFSRGYTSLDEGSVQAAPSRPRTSWWKRWMQRRAARRVQREMEEREAEERRLDELLEKVHREGRAALTAEEVRFMKRVSDRYRGRNSSQ